MKAQQAIACDLLLVLKFECKFLDHELMNYVVGVNYLQCWLGFPNFIWARVVMFLWVSLRMGDGCSISHVSHRGHTHVLFMCVMKLTSSSLIGTLCCNG